MKRVAVAAMCLFLVLGSSAVLAQTLTDVYTVQQMGFPEGTYVEVDSIVVTGIDSAPGTFGFWAQEKAGGPYGGVLVYSGSIGTGGLRLGHVVTVKGMYEEYPSGLGDSLSVTEITYGTEDIEWTIIDSMDVPDPVLLSCRDLGILPTDYARGEQWEGTLVTFDSVIVVRHDPTYTSSYFFVEYHNHPPSTTADTVYVRNNKLTSPGPGRPPLNQVLESITGLAHYENGRYHLCPRDVDDIVYAGAPPAPNLALAFATSNTTVQAVFDCRLDRTTAENTSNYYFLSLDEAPASASLDLVGEQVVTLTTTSTQTPGDLETLAASGIKSKGGTQMPEAQQESFRAGLMPISMVQTPKSAENDSSIYVGEELTTAGIVTADKDAYITHFYLEQSGGGPWSGIQIYGGIPGSVAEGDSVIVAGFLSEYYYKTELTSVDYLNVVSSGNPVPGPDLLDPSLINNASTPAEQYEGVFVKCNPVQVVDTTGWASFGEWRVADLTPDTVLIAHSGDYTYVPSLGKWMGIQGPLDYAYGTFRIEPRRDSDIDTINVIGVDPGTEPKPPVFALSQNVPNPFNPVTTIFFSVPGNTEVELRIYDISGRLVKTLIDGVPLEVGKHKAIWDGRNDAGRAVSSGVYFCKLVADKKVAETKMVLLK